MSKATVIETRNVERAYGFNGVDVIIEHPKHGRLLVCDGFGGMDTLRGGAVRWEHGVVCKLHDDDTLDGLDADWNEGTSIYQAVTQGYDDSRPLQPWDGRSVAAIAESCRL